MQTRPSRGVCAIRLRNREIASPTDHDRACHTTTYCGTTNPERWELPVTRREWFIYYDNVWMNHLYHHVRIIAALLLLLVIIMSPRSGVTFMFSVCFRHVCRCKDFCLWRQNRLCQTLVVVVFYWPLGSKQISRSIYIHITHTKHGKKLTSAHQSNQEVNIASVSVDFVWYMIFFPNLLKQAYKFYLEMRHHITVPLGRACHATTTQPIPIFRLLQQSG